MKTRGSLVLVLVHLGLTGALLVGGGRAAGSVRLYLPSVVGSPAEALGHKAITSYTGPETCVACHRTEAQQAHNSTHYQLTGATPNVPNISGNAGKGEGGMNTYCGAISTSRDVTCAGCHAGYGQKPVAEASEAQLDNIDCLMCHQAAYARKPAGPYEQVPAKGQDGKPRMLSLPIETEKGFHFMPDEAKMPISLVDAARTAGPTTRATCLRCHANAGGGDGTKRGDLSSADADPTLTHDLHMSPQGHDMTCSDCHDAGNHRVSGRGLDLRQNDVTWALTCAKCHGSRPHKDYNPREGESMDAHAARVACQTCHIPVFGKDVSTELARDWRTAVWWPAAFNGQGGWKPEEERATNVVPSYRWFDLTSNVYLLGQSPVQNADGEYVFGAPRGSVSSSGAKIYPMKEHRSVAARHDGTGQMIPHSTEVFFRTGDFAQAVAAGAADVGLAGPYTVVGVHTFQTINHGVESADRALACSACHADTSGGGDERSVEPPRMDLVGALGYGLKGPMQTVCSVCHEPETPEGFVEMHDKHVGDKGYDCVWCHNFSRPERGLDRP